MGAGAFGRQRDLICSRVRPRIGDVLADAAVEQGRVLGDRGDGAAQTALRDVGDVLAIDDDAAGLQVVEALDQLDEGRLARAGGTDQGDALARDNAVQMLEPLSSLATLITPNLPEAAALCEGAIGLALQRAHLLRDTPHLLIKGGHGDGDTVVNQWFTDTQHRSWQWPRLAGEFHGSGCTLAAAIAACLAQGQSMASALHTAQVFTQHSLEQAYAIADGQLIPSRIQEKK